MKKISLIMPIILLWQLYISTANAAPLWSYKKIDETAVLTQNRFYLNTAADLNQNGKKEVVVADFGRNGEIQDGWRQQPKLFNVFLLEWVGKKLKVVWQKKWNTKSIGSVEQSRKYSFWKAKTMHALARGDQTIVETVAPFLMLEWTQGKYILREQYLSRTVPFVNIGSHAFPWFTGQCHPVFDMGLQYPRECLVAIRDFKRDGQPRILTSVNAFHDGTVLKATDKYRLVRPDKFTLRIRKWAPGFPIEWQQQRPRQTRATLHDIYNAKLPGPLVIYETGSSATIRRLGGYPFYVFDWNKKQGYHLRKLKWDKGPKEGLAPHWLEVLRMGYTRSKETLETWGYRRVKAYDGNYASVLRSMSVRPDLQGHTWHDLTFKTHQYFYGVGYYDLADLDNDGLEEIIVVEETGKRKVNHDEHGTDWVYRDVKDYIRILKWNGKKYITKWVSPAFTKKGVKFLFADIKGSKKKALVVFNPAGTVQVWERQ